MAYYTQGQGLISQRRGNASYFYHYDGLGSTKALTDANQNIQASYKYDAWGNTLQTSGIITNPYLYVGELGYYGDGDSGKYLLTQRWYNPVIGRFVVRDAHFEEQGYFYCLNTPTNTTDPSGLSPIGDLKEEWRKCAEKAIKKWCQGVKTNYTFNGQKAEVNYKLIRRMILAESSDDPKRKKGDAEGLMQIKTRLHRDKCNKALAEICLKHPYDPYNPCDNITCGVYLLCQHFKGKISGKGGYGTIISPGSSFDKCMHSFKP